MEMSRKFSDFFVLLFPSTEPPFLSFLFCHLRSGLELKVPVGKGTFPIVNKACRGLLSGALKPQTLIHSLVKESMGARAPTLTAWLVFCLPRRLGEFPSWLSG